MTGTLAPMGVPSALAGRVRSPRSFTPSDMGMARSLLTEVCVYCAGRGCQVWAAAAAGAVAASAGVTRASGPATRAPATAGATSRRANECDDIWILPWVCREKRRELERVTEGDRRHAAGDSDTSSPRTSG